LYIGYELGFPFSSAPTIFDTPLYPGKTITDELLFEPPVDGCDYLDLALPAENVHGQGILHIRIPASFVNKSEDR
jgi:hypothetical protein